MRLLQQVRAESLPKDDLLFSSTNKKGIPKHLRRVLHTKKRRSVYAMKRLVELAEHSDVKLWEDIRDGFSSLGNVEKTG